MRFLAFIPISYHFARKIGTFLTGFTDIFQIFGNFVMTRTRQLWYNETAGSAGADRRVLRCALPKLTERCGSIPESLC